MNHKSSVVGGAAVLLLLTIAAGCGESGSTADDASTTPDAVTSPTVTLATDRTSPATTSPATGPTTTLAKTSTTALPTSEAAPAVSDDELAAQIEAVLAEAIAPGSIRWDANGVDIPPTASVAAVRIPGRDDVVVAVGKDVDGSPAVAGAPIPVAGLTESLVRTVAFQMVDEGLLDPTLTVDRWAPTMPNADRVTVQMVIDGATGWGDSGPIEPDPVITDFARAWSLREVVELRATTTIALAEPGTRTDDSGAAASVLGLVLEDSAGRPLAALVRERVAAPAGLDDTGLLDGGRAPAGYRHGVFAFNGTPAVTSAFDGTSFLTWNQATTSAVSTPSDLLDLLDVWATGELFTTDRTAAPDRFVPALDATDFVVGVGIPFNGYCPCTDVDGGIEPTTTGRRPGSIGTATYLWRYGDGISVVLNVNSNEHDDPADLDAVVGALYDLAVAAR
jgi:CubicO group peptidase (beta-lactamase class C family)